MSDAPAGWYDDPEDASQYRYWDGDTWTDHRAPRYSSASGAGTTTTAETTGTVLAAGWNLFARNWRALVIVGVATMVAMVAIVVVFLVGANSVFEPSLIDIADRVTDPGFNAANDPADEAFIESIAFNPTPSFWALTAICALMLLVVQGFGFGLVSVHIAADHVGRHRPLGQSFGVALARLPRWIGVGLLWLLAYLAFGAVWVPLILLAVEVPVLWLGLGPAAIGLAVWMYPTFWLLGTALAVGPTEKPPFRTTLAMVRSGWRKAAWPVLFINLVSLAVSFGLALVGAVPILGAFISAAGNSLMYAYLACTNAALWTRLGGEVGADIAPQPTSAG